MDEHFEEERTKRSFPTWLERALTLDPSFAGGRPIFLKPTKIGKLCGNWGTNENRVQIRILQDYQEPRDYAEGIVCAWECSRA